MFVLQDLVHTKGRALTKWYCDSLIYNSCSSKHITVGYALGQDCYFFILYLHHLAKCLEFIVLHKYVLTHRMKDFVFKKEVENAKS